MKCSNKIRKWYGLWLIKRDCGAVMITQIRIAQQRYDFFCLHCGHCSEKPFGPGHPFYKKR